MYLWRVMVVKLEWFKLTLKAKSLKEIYNAIQK